MDLRFNLAAFSINGLLRQGLGAISIGLLTVVSPGLSAGGAMQPSDGFSAVLTSRHAIYAVDEPIDLTLWIKAQLGPIAPAFEVRDEHGRIVPMVPRDKREFETKAIGPIKPHANFLTTLPDLRHWFELRQPGDYTVTFVGKSTSAGKDALALRSNPLGIAVRDHVQSQVIPLRQIWALDMPGTRPMNRIQNGDPPVYDAPEGRLVDEILAALANTPRERRLAGYGFAVQGSGMKALREAHAVIVLGSNPTSSFRTDVPVSLVFYCRESNYYTWVVGAERRDSTIEIQYRFVPHETKELTSHFAIIPLPAGMAGAIHVDVLPQIDSDSAGLDWGTWPRRIVSGSFDMKLTESK